MTLLHQKYPAELNEDDRILIERAQAADLAQRVQAVLAARNWQRQCEENEKSLQQERLNVNKARRWARAWKRVVRNERYKDRLLRERYRTLERQLAETQQALGEAVAEAGILYKTLQEIRRDVHFTYRREDTTGDKWDMLCMSIVAAIDDVTPNNTTGAKEAQRLWDADRQLHHASGIIKDLQDKMQPVNEYVATLEQQIAHLCSFTSRPLGYDNSVVLVDRAALHALARLAHLEETQIEQPPPPWDETRCRVCGWPLVESTEQGCTKDSCSMRPLPKIRADEGYAPSLDTIRAGGRDG